MESHQRSTRKCGVIYLRSDDEPPTRETEFVEFTIIDKGQGVMELTITRDDEVLACHQMRPGLSPLLDALAKRLKRPHLIGLAGVFVVNLLC